MSARSDIYHLLVTNAGHWVSRDDIDFLGGTDASRRMRELEEDVSRSNEWRLDRQRDDKGRYQYRLLPIVPDPPKATGIFRCTKCGSRPGNVTVASIDPRWRLGHCPVCGKDATFEKSPA